MKRALDSEPGGGIRILEQGVGGKDREERVVDARGLPAGPPGHEANVGAGMMLLRGISVAGPGLAITVDNGVAEGFGREGWMRSDDAGLVAYSPFMGVLGESPRGDAGVSVAGNRAGTDDSRVMAVGAGGVDVDADDGGTAFQGQLDEQSDFSGIEGRPTAEVFLEGLIVNIQNGQRPGGFGRAAQGEGIERHFGDVLGKAPVLRVKADGHGYDGGRERWGNVRPPEGFGMGGGW